MLNLLFLKNNAYEIIFGICLMIILIIGIYRIISGKKGSWSDEFYYNPENNIKKNQSNNPYKPKRKVVKESKGEIECRRVLENYFKRSFKKARPNIMNNEVTNFNLEIDCFCPELMIGCEYNGRQHYEYIPFFHRNKDAYQNQKYRDYMKRNLCNKHGIRLIEVPYTVKTYDIKKFIHKKLKQLGY